MSEQNKKRSKNDERRQHVDRQTGLPKKRLIEQQRAREADKERRDFCYTEEEKNYPTNYPN